MALTEKLPNPNRKKTLKENLPTYRTFLMNMSVHDEYLEIVNQRKWLFLFKNAFNIKEVTSVSIEQTRALIFDIHDAIHDEEFLENFKKKMLTVSSSEKKKQLLAYVFPLEMLIMHTHGFKGDHGYIQAKRALMDFQYDPEIEEALDCIHKNLFQVADL